MPRQSKSKSEVVETPAPVVSSSVVVEQVASSSSSSVEKPKKKEPKVKAEASSPAAESTQTSAPVSTPPSAPVSTPPSVPETTHVEVVEGDVVDIVAQSAEFLSKLNQLGGLFTSLKTEFRSLEKKWSRELKTAQKSQAKRKRKSGNRQPSGFVKPTKISDELAKFLERPVGSEMARTDVTREINKYIRLHNLQDKDNGRKINPDAKLQTLLKIKKTDELTYFNLQRYMSPHFFKTEKPVTVAATVSTA
jgi:upstream activation factor subunit UAF30